MTNQEMIDKAHDELMAKHGHCRTSLLADAINAGLVSGDRISLGGPLVAHIMDGDMVEMWANDKMTARLPLSGLTQEQRDRMLILKGIHAGFTGWETGTCRH